MKFFPQHLFRIKCIFSVFLAVSYQGDTQNPIKPQVSNSPRPIGYSRMRPNLKQIKRLALPSLAFASLLQAGCMAQGGNLADSGPIQLEKNQKESEKRSVASRTDTNSVPKNIIVFIGDGMGISTIRTLRCRILPERRPRSCPDIKRILAP